MILNDGHTGINMKYNGLIGKTVVLYDYTTRSESIGVIYGVDKNIIVILWGDGEYIDYNLDEVDFENIVGRSEIEIYFTKRPRNFCP